MGRWEGRLCSSENGFFSVSVVCVVYVWFLLFRLPLRLSYWYDEHGARLFPNCRYRNAYGALGAQTMNDDTYGAANRWNSARVCCTVARVTDNALTAVWNGIYVWRDTIIPLYRKNGIFLIWLIPNISTSKVLQQFEIYSAIFSGSQHF